MGNELMTFVTVVSVLASIFMGVITLLRNHKKDSKHDAKELAVISEQLKNIKDGVEEIRSDFKVMREDFDGLKLESKLETAAIKKDMKAAFKRIDELKEAFAKK